MDKIVSKNEMNCTVILDGSECKVKFDRGFRAFAIENNSSGDVYVSIKPGVTAGDDGVRRIKSGCSSVFALRINEKTDAIYLTGTGSVQIHAQNDNINPFRNAPVSDGGGEVTVDEWIYTSPDDPGGLLANIMNTTEYNGGGYNISGGIQGRFGFYQSLSGYNITHSNLTDLTNVKRITIKGATVANLDGLSATAYYCITDETITELGERWTEIHSSSGTSISNFSAEIDCSNITGKKYLYLAIKHGDESSGYTSYFYVDKITLSGEGAGYNVIALTRSEFDAITKKDPDTYYVITDDVGETTTPVVLNVGAGREFTSFTDAMWIASQITGQKVVINVFAGEYDVYSELGGNDFVLGIGDKKYYEFQPVLSGDVEIRGIGNVILKLEIPDDIYSSNINNCRKISIIHNDRNILVENITFVTKNCRYSVHDECGNNALAANTKHIIRNCRFYNTNTLCVIGVGCVSPSYKIENCYAENTNGCLFLHDWDVSSGGNLTVSNCVFESESNNEVLFSAHSESTFDVFLTNNNFEHLAVSSIDATKYEKNIFRIIGVGNIIPNVTVADGLTNPYPVKLV